MFVGLLAVFISAASLVYTIQSNEALEARVKALEALRQ